MKNKLIGLGLTAREADAYLGLAELGECTVSQLAKSIKEHRTNIYDSLTGLVKKALIVCVVKRGVNHYRVAEPEKLLDFIRDKEEIAQNIIPDLKARLRIEPEIPSVEVFEGATGFKSVLNLMIRVNRTIYGIGASDEWAKRFPEYLQRYMEQRTKYGLHAKLLYLAEQDPIEHDLNEVRFLPAEHASPSTVAIFGEYVAIFLWTTPLVAIVTRSQHLSSSFMRYFDMLWKTAETIKSSGR